MSKEKTMNFWRQQKDIIYFVVVGVVIIGILVCIRGVVNNNEGLVIVIVTTALVLTTMYYSLLNKRLYLLNERLLAATDLPKVILDIRPWNTGKKQYVFVIENVGTGIALDIEIKMLSDTPLMLNSKLSLEDACAKINLMPPKQNYKLLIEGQDWDDEKNKRSYRIKVSYKNSRDKKCSKEFSLSIDAIHYYLQGDLVAERLREIAVHAKEIANQSSSTNTTTPDEQEEQEWIARAVREQQEEQERIARAVREQQEWIAQVEQVEQEAQEWEAQGRSG